MFITPVQFFLARTRMVFSTNVYVSIDNNHFIVLNVAYQHSMLRTTVTDHSSTSSAMMPSIEH